MKLLDRQPDPDVPPHWDIKEIEGRWPDALRGSLLRNGPALFRRGDETRPYLLDGDGLAQRWIVDGEGIRHQAAWIRTRKFDQETSRRQFVQPGFSTKGVSLAALARTDDFNTANTNLIHFNGSLLALWEAGSAHQLHLDDLSTQGPMVWSEQTRDVPFGAHPKRDHCGNLWNIGISGDLLVLYVISPGGKPVSTTVHRVRPTALVHDFILTERYVGVWLAPLVLNLNDVDQGSSLLDAMTWASAQGSQLLLFNRQTQQIEHQLELEAELIFHFANAWEHNDSLVVQYVRSHPDVLRHQLMSKAAAVAQPMEGGTQLVTRRIQLPSGVSTVHCGARQTEFPQIDLRFQGRASQVCFCLIGSAHDGAGDYNGLLREVATGGHRQVWFADVGIVLEEHVHVPEHDHSPEGAGWLIGSGFDRTRNQSFCSVFDAERLEDGPLAVAYLNGSAPMALHGEFVPLR